MISCKKTILGTIIISMIFVATLFQKHIYVGNDNGVGSKHGGYYTNTGKHNLMEKIIECMSYGNTNVVTAYKADGQWRAEINAYELKRNWEPIDTLELQTSDGMNISS